MIHVHIPSRTLFSYNCVSSSSTKKCTYHNSLFNFSLQHDLGVQERRKKAMDFATRCDTRRPTRIKRMISFFYFLGRQFVVDQIVHVHVFDIESSVNASISLRLYCTHACDLTSAWV